ncbi:MAG TPA: hypothetical protein DCQ83_03785 [Fibrobacteres bacterium]|nr:hypothetical protein [Fibrobacterota bacterium]
MSEGTKKPFSPLILGIVGASRLADRRYPEAVWACGGVELRADGLPIDGVLPAIEGFAAEQVRREFRGPVVFTLRLQRDGGAWENSRAKEREAVWCALASRSHRVCDIVDVEIEEAASLSSEMWKLLRASGLKVMLSHHAFSIEAPHVWEEQLGVMRAYHPDAVKFAISVKDTAMAGDLLRFGKHVAEEFPLSCVIGMGENGAVTRVASPLLGCPITYAFLEEGPVAPGQLPLKVLQSVFAKSAMRPKPEDSAEKWIAWVENELAEISRAV